MENEFNPLQLWLIFSKFIRKKLFQSLIQNSLTSQNNTSNPDYYTSFGFSENLLSARILLE
jgi:hypothetical protein